MKKIFAVLLILVISYTELKAQCDAHAGQDQAVCGLTVLPNAYFTAGGYSGQWSYLDGPCANPVFQNATQPYCHIDVCQYGIYRFIWTISEDANPSNICRDTISVEFIEFPIISAGVDQWVCGDSVYLHAYPAVSSAGRTWMTAPATWINLTTHQADTSAQRDPITIAHHFHTTNDSVIFQWQEWNFSTLQTIPNTMTCVSRDTMIVHFYIDHPAIEYVDSQWDTVQCGNVYDGLIAQVPPEGYGYWIDTVGTSNFTPSPFSLNATVTANTYGIHHFYWVTQNGTRPNGTPVCKDTSDVIPIRFIQMPVANAGGNLWAANPNASSEIKWDTVCGNKYAMHPTLYGVGTVQWQTASTNNRWFISSHASTSPMPNDTLFTQLFNSDQTAPPYYFEVYLQLDNSTLPFAPFSHGCIDRDTIRITFVRIPTGEIQFRQPYCYGTTSLITAEYDQGKPNQFSWTFNGGQIDSMAPNYLTPTNPWDTIYYVSWDTVGGNITHIVSLSTSNAWGCLSPITSDTIFEPTLIYPFDSIFATICMQPNGRIKLFNIDSLHTTYYWLDPQFALNPVASEQYNLSSGIPYHVRFRYDSWESNQFCSDTIEYIIPDISQSIISGSIIYPGSQTDQFSAALYNTAGTNGWHLTQTTPVIGNSYHFSNVNSGSYALKIINETMTSNILSTYYVQSAGWQGATTFTSACDTFNNFNIHMISLPDVPGNGTVSGMITYDAGSEKLIGEPVPGAYVYLNSEPSDVFAKYTITNDSGYYEITNVHNGSYSVYVDIPGLPQITTYNFSVSNTDLNFPNINFIVDTNSAISKDYEFGIYADTSLISVKNISASENNILVYPNPISDFVTVQMQLEKPEQISIEIFDILGRKYYELINSNSFSGNVIKTIDVRALQSGTYILKVTSNNKTKSFNLVR